MNATEQSIKTNSLFVVDTQQLAGFWIRCGAFTIDFLLAGLIASIIGVLLSSDIFFTISFFLLFIIIHIFSPGKHIAGIAVVSINGLPLTYFRSIARCSLGPALLFLISLGLLSLQMQLEFFSILRIDYLDPPVSVVLAVLLVAIFFAIAASPHKRALHDYLAGTRVVYIKKINLWRKAGVVCVGLPLVVFGMMYILFVIR